MDSESLKIRKGNLDKTIHENVVRSVSDQERQLLVVDHRVLDRFELRLLCSHRRSFASLIYG